MQDATLTTTIQQRILKDLVLPRSPGARIPPEKELASSYGVSITTVRRAVGLLEESGQLERRQGAGTFVRQRQTVRQVGILVPEVGYGSFYQHMAIGLEPFLRRKGCHNALFVADGSSFDFQAMRTALQTQDILVFCGYGADPAFLQAIEVPYLFIGNEESVDVPYVGIDMPSGIRLAVRHLMETGCRHLHYFTHFAEDQQERLENSKRYFGFRQACYEFGLPFVPGQVRRAGNRFVDWQRHLDAVLADGPVDAILCSNDTMAQAVVGMLAERQIRVPAEVSVVGCNNITPIDEQPLPLTTLDFRLDRMADFVAALIEAQLEGRDMQGEFSLFLRPDLIVRSTTRAV